MKAENDDQLTKGRARTGGLNLIPSQKLQRQQQSTGVGKTTLQTFFSASHAGSRSKGANDDDHDDHDDDDDDPVIVVTASKPAHPPSRPQRRQPLKQESGNVLLLVDEDELPDLFVAGRTDELSILDHVRQTREARGARGARGASTPSLKCSSGVENTKVIPDSVAVVPFAAERAYQMHQEAKRQKRDLENFDLVCDGDKGRRSPCRIRGPTCTTIAPPVARAVDQTDAWRRPGYQWSQGKSSGDVHTTTTTTTTLFNPPPSSNVACPPVVNGSHHHHVGGGAWWAEADLDFQEPQGAESTAAVQGGNGTTRGEGFDDLGMDEDMAATLRELEEAEREQQRATVSGSGRRPNTLRTSTATTTTTTTAARGGGGASGRWERRDDGTNTFVLGDGTALTGQAAYKAFLRTKSGGRGNGGGRGGRKPFKKSFARKKRTTGGGTRSRTSATKNSQPGKTRIKKE